MRITIHICTQCAKHNAKRDALPSECQPFAKRVYADSFRRIGDVIEVDGAEREWGGAR